MDSDKEKRVTIKADHPRKTFYERFLMACKEMSDSRNQKYILYNAVLGLKAYPLELNGIQDLKQVKGFGDQLASNCDAAWRIFAEEMEKDGQNSDHRAVRALNGDDYIRYMQAVNRGGGRKRQFDNSKSDKDSKKEQRNGNANGHKQKGETIKARDKRKGADDEFEEDDEFTEPQEKKKRNEPSTSKSSAGSSKPSTSKATSNSPKKSSAKGKKKDGDDDRPNDASGATQTQSKNIDEDREIEIVTCQPSDRAKVVLIADSREHRNYGFYAKSVVEHIAKSGFEFDVRSMPVGDYMWLARKEDGTEMVLDWVVERKTWDDLQSSIIGGRYLEQKGRLLKSPMRSRVYLIEGNEKSEESPCHQALMTTLINHGFLVHRSPSMRDTSKFLERITLRLINAVQTEDLSGVDFRDLQTLVEKPQAETVSEAWMTQLMCFRGMSESRATALARRFPTFVALRRFIDSSSNPVKHLLKEVESLNEPTANRIVAFFKTKPE